MVTTLLMLSNVCGQNQQILPSPMQFQSLLLTQSGSLTPKKC